MLPDDAAGSFKSEIRKKKISLIDDLEEETLFEVFRGKQELTWEEVIDRDLVKLMLELKAQGKVEVNYEVKDKRTKKTIKKVTSKLNFEQLEEISEGLRANAKRQIDLINVLQSIDSGEWLDVKWLTEEYGITAIRNFFICLGSLPYCSNI